MVRGQLWSGHSVGARGIRLRFNEHANDGGSNFRVHLFSACTSLAWDCKSGRGKKLVSILPQLAYRSFLFSLLLLLLFFNNLETSSQE